MKPIGIVILSSLLLLSCSSENEIPFTQLNNYFFKNNVEFPSSPMIDSQADFEHYFGMATVMGKNGMPTPVDFDKEFVIAVVNPVTDNYTEMAPISLVNKNGTLVFTYRETVGDKQTYSIQPILLIKVDRTYKTDQVMLLFER